MTQNEASGDCGRTRPPRCRLCPMSTAIVPPPPPRLFAMKVSPFSAPSLASADPGRATVLPSPRSGRDSAPQNLLGDVAPPVGGVANV